VLQNILKKTLIAAAIAATATAATAATVVANGGATSTFTEKKWQSVSAEGLAIAKTVAIGTAADDILVSLTLDSTYQETDLLVMTIAGATIDATATTTVTIGATTFELLGVDADAGTVTLRPASTTTVAAGTYAVSGIVLKAWSGAATLASKGVTVQGIDIDKGAAVPIAFAGSEFTVKSGVKFDAVVDVEKERKEYVSGTTDSFTVAVKSGADLLAVTAGKATVALTGADLAFLNDKDGKLASASYALDVLTEDTAKTTFVGNTLTVMSTAGYAASFGMTLTADGKADVNAQALTGQSFSADVDLAYAFGGTSGSVSTDNIAVGAWTLSGAQVNIPYMPYGPSITQVIYLSNDGTVNGDIELVGFDDEGNQFGPVTLSITAVGGSVTRLAGPIKAALLEEGFDGNGKVDITLTVNSPKADVEIYAAYNVTGDRATVIATKAP
jgi:hypothetical protein